jgi:predicted membrane protein
VRRLAMLVMFISLAVVGSMIKIPFTLGSIALDSAPAVVAALLLGPLFGAAVAFVGHLMSAWFGGFPLGPLHLLVAVEMGLLLYVVGMLAKRGWKKASALFFFIGNAWLAPLPFAFFISWSFVWTILPSLSLATAINLTIALLVVPTLEKAMTRNERHA